MLRKINGILGIIISLFLPMHSLLECMTRVRNITGGPGAPARAFFMLVLTHIVISLILINIKHEAKGGPVVYPAFNKRTLLQRISGIFAIIPIVLHVVFIILMATGARVPYALVNILFAIMVFLASMHMALSLTKGFVTAGIVRNEKTVKVIDGIAVILMAFTDVAGILVLVYR